MSIWGNPVQLGGGGSSGAPILTRAQWNALSTAQKQAYGYVGIEDAVSGFFRGELVYGADYIGSLLSSSVAADVLAEAPCENYSSSLPLWGGLWLSGQSAFAVESDGAVRMSSAGQYAFYTLNAADTPFTAYMVSKSRSTASGDYRLMMATYANNSGNAPGFFRKNANLWTTAFGQDADSGCSAAVMNVIAMSVSGPGGAAFFVNGEKTSVKTLNHSGATIGFGGEPNQFGSHDDVDVYYAAVVSGAEADATVIANMQSIMAHYGIGGE